MSKDLEIRQLLYRLIKSNFPVQSFEAEVKAVDRDAFTCSLLPTDGSPELFDARLTAVVDDTENYLVVFPKKGSIVLAMVIQNDPNEAFVVSMSEIDAIAYQIGERTFQADKDGHVFDGGEQKGLPLAEKVTERLNGIEDKFNDLAEKIQSWSPVPQDGGAALKASLASVSTLTKTQVSDIENTQIKQ